MTIPTGPSGTTKRHASTDLVHDLPRTAYVFVQHVLSPGQATPMRTRRDGLRTVIVTAGTAVLEAVGPDNQVVSLSSEKFSGWHIPAGTAFRLVNPSTEPVVVVEAGTPGGEGDEVADWDDVAPTDRALPVSAADYTVQKPWGHEIWYTQNLDAPPYAVKKIFMTAGHRSSLQSHRFKMETNYVIDGQATVLNGRKAPEDVDTSVDVDLIPVTVHQPGTGWSSAPNILHRVIARETYASIEVSTNELDDVIRWQDDTSRPDGRIGDEHAGGTR